MKRLILASNQLPVSIKHRGKEFAIKKTDEQTIS